LPDLKQVKKTNDALQKNTGRAHGAQRFGAGSEKSFILKLWPEVPADGVKAKKLFQERMEKK